MTEIQVWIMNRKAELLGEISAADTRDANQVHKLIARYCELGEFYKACRHCGLLDEEGVV